MASLSEDLQNSKTTLREFADLTSRLLNYFPEVITSTAHKSGYAISSSNSAGTIKYIRPINNTLFIKDSIVFNEKYADFELIILKIKRKDIITTSDENLIDSMLYTIQQSIGAGLDLLVNPNSARKHVGNRFEELMRALFTAIGISNKKMVLQIPYTIGNKTQLYQCENDMVLSPYPEVKSEGSIIDPNEIVVSIKTTSKDRMGKMFLDKILLERFLKHPQKMIGVFLNDVQRKGEDNVSYTLVSGLFMVYSQFLTEMNGVYYLDLPSTAQKASFAQYMKPFSQLITRDIHTLLTP